METLVRAFPIKSKAALDEFGKEIDRLFSTDDKRILAEEFGLGRESWYYQEIEGKPYVIAIACGETLDKGFETWGTTKDPFAVWFRAQVLELTGHDLAIAPKGPPSELVYELRM